MQGCIGLASIVKTWSQTVRDTEFLVEMRLQNLEPESKLAESEFLEGDEPILAEDDDEE